MLDVLKHSTVENFYLKICGLKPTAETDEEWSLPCVLHDEKKGKALGIRKKDGSWNCLGKCQVGGGPTQFYARLKKITEEQAEEELKVLLGVVRTVPAALVKECHERLLKTPNILTYLNEKRGITRDTIVRFELGFDGERLIIPVQVGGVYVNLRRYKWLHGTESVDKMLSYSDGSGFKFGEARLYPDAHLHNDLPILLCEGEMDCLLACTLGYNAVTVTGGAGTWKTEFTKALAGKVVRVCYDIDAAGKKGSATVARALGRAAKEVKVINLPITEPKNGDFTNFIVDAGFGKKDFDELIEKAEVYKPKGRDQFALDPSVNQVSLEDATHEGYFRKTVEYSVIVSGKDTAPYLVPKRVKYSCDMSMGKRCGGCGLGPHGYQGELTVEITDPVEILEFIGSPKSAQDMILAKNVDLAKCPVPKVEIEEEQNVERVRVIPEVGYTVEKKTAYVSRDVFVLGQKIQSNTAYTMRGVTVPEPKRQYATQVVYSAEPNQLSIDAFRMSPGIKAELSKFQVRPGETMRDRLAAIYEDLSVNVTQIYKREDIMQVIDLVYHSVLQFRFLGRMLKKGWCEALIIGDTRCGKSETLEKMLVHYRAGEYLTGECTSYAGLIGGVSEVQERKFISWGKIPLNDRRLVALDEVSGLSEDQISLMSSVRSSGVAEILKIMNERTNARTRWIWSSNPRSGRNLESYSHGVFAIRELIGKVEDVARFDIAVTAATGEVPKGIAFDMRDKKVEHVYTSDLCNLGVMWAWSRTPDQVVIGKDTEEAVHRAVDELSDKYSSEVPLVEPSEQRIKVIRLATALAARLFSTVTGEEVVVTPEHVAEVTRFMQACYDKPSMGYDAFSRATKKVATIPDNELDEIKREMKKFRDWTTLRDILLELDTFKKNELVDQLGYDFEQARDLFRWLGKRRLIRAVPLGYVKHAAFSALLKSVVDDKESAPEPSAY